MIKNAKVSLQAVKRFAQSVAEVRDYTPRFDKGIACFEDFQDALSELISVMRESIGNMESAQNRLASKIKEIEAEIAKLTAELNDLENRLSSLEDRLASIPETLEITNERGKNYVIPNPEYGAIVAQIAVVELEIRKINARLTFLQQRLDRANTIDGKLSSQIDASNSAICSLQEKQNACRQYMAELEEVRKHNLRQGTNAAESLREIESVILRYLQIKMIYEATSPNAQVSTVPYSVESADNNTKNISQKPDNEGPSKIEYYDDQNVKYREGDRLLPNTQFMMKGYEYSTDEKGRIVSAKGKLRIDSRKRDMEDVKKIENQEYKEKDDRGHLIAHMFGGSDRLENLIPMNAKLNQGDYKSMEEMLKNAVEHDSEVHIQVEPIYEDDTTRPSRIRVIYTIDGDMEIRMFKNESGEE